MSSAIKVANTASKRGHILVAKHAWNKVISSSVTWAKVAPIIQKVLLYGQLSSYNNWPTKQMYINGELVVVRYKIEQGVLVLVDAWVKTR